MSMSSRFQPTARAVRAALSVLLATAVVAQVPLAGSANPTSLPVVGTHFMIVPSIDAPLGTMTFAGPENEPGAILSVSASPFGGGEAVRVGSEWRATFASGYTATVGLNPVYGCLDFYVDELGVGGFLAPFDPLTAPESQSQDSQDVGVQSRGKRLPEGGMLFQVRWPVAFDELIGQVLFLQFVSIKAEAIRRTPAGDVLAAFPPDSTIKVSGNGGKHGTAEERIAGAGFAKVDGSTVYLDSADPGIPGYVDSGFAGRRYQGGALMADHPEFTPFAFADLISALPNPMEIVGIRSTMEFDTYLFLNGTLLGRWKWTWALDVFLDGTSAGCDTSPPQLVVPPTFDLKHALALSEFMAGDYSGVPK